MSIEELSIENISDLKQALEIIKFLLKENVELKAEIVALKLQVSNLTDEVARLKKNSSTSSKPPSSDITKPPNERRQAGRKQGGQKGHKGFWRNKFDSTEIDEIKELHIKACPKCGSRRLEPESVELIKKNHQAELVDKPIKITEYILFGRHCPCCNKTHFPSLPDGVIPSQLLGPKLIALCGYMKASMGVSVSDLQEYFADVLKLRVSRSTIQNTIFRVSKALQPSHEEALASLPQQSNLNIDETGWADNGKRHWVWVFCNSLIAYFSIHKSRGCEVLKQILGETFDGSITSDFYSAYVCYASPKQQFCLAHLIRDIKFLTTLSTEESKIFGETLLRYMRSLFKLWHNRRNLSFEQFQKKTNRIKNSLQNYISTQEFPKGSDARRMQRRMIKHWKAMFCFLEFPDELQPTNNAAERDIRHLVRLRRISQGTRGTLGIEWTQRAATVVVSCRKSLINPWTFFQQAVSSHFFGSQAPSLIRPS